MCSGRVEVTAFCSIRWCGVRADDPCADPDFLRQHHHLLTPSTLRGIRPSLRGTQVSNHQPPAGLETASRLQVSGGIWMEYGQNKFNGSVHCVKTGSETNVARSRGPRQASYPRLPGNSHVLQPFGQRDIPWPSIQGALSIGGIMTRPSTVTQR